MGVYNIYAKSAASVAQWHFPCNLGVAGSIPGLSSPSDETINRDPMTVFQVKQLTKTYCDEAGDYALPNVLSPRGLVFRSDLQTKTAHMHTNSFLDGYQSLSSLMFT